MAKLESRETATWKWLYGKSVKWRTKLKEYEEEAMGLEAFIEMSEKSCTYCGCAPKMPLKDRYSDFHVFYNGIDRIDSAYGYSEENTTPCCGDCNRAKGVMTVQEFHAWIERVYINLQKC